MSTIKARKYTVGEPPETIDLEPTMAALQEFVGGSFELLTTSKRTWIFNEDGELLGLPRNEQAHNAVLADLAADGRHLHPGDYITGPTLAVGPTSDDGELTDWTDN